MKFNPTTKKLYTSDNVFIKRLHCPWNMRWQDMSEINAQQRHCASCEKNVMDIQGLSDAEVLAIAQQDKNACFKLNINSSNIQVINHNVD